MTEPLNAPLWMTLIVVCGFLFDWIVAIFNWKKVRPFSKPLAMLLVIVWSLVSTQFAVNGLVLLLLAAQVFGLLGDILLLFPGKWFVWGLGAFLIGHFFYLGILFVTLFSGFGGDGLSVSEGLAILVGLAVWVGYLLSFTRFLSPHVYKEKVDLPFWCAVVFYGAVLSFFVVLSTLCIIIFPEFSWIRICLPVGAALFFVSDNLLAYDRFVEEIRFGRFWVIMTYHLGQFGLAVGFMNLIGSINELPV